MLDYILYITILWQTTPVPTPTPTARRVDPGNDPIFTYVMFAVFMLVLLGGGAMAFRYRINRMRRLEQKSASPKPVVPSVTIDKKDRTRL